MIIFLSGMIVGALCGLIFIYWITVAQTTRLEFTLARLRAQNNVLRSHLASVLKNKMEETQK